MDCSSIFQVRTAALSLWLLLSAGAGVAAAQDRPDVPAPEWWLLTGYGETHPGYGETSQLVRTADVLLRYRHPIRRTGREGYRGTHDLLMEAAYSHLLEPEDRAPILALNLLACWTLQRWDGARPYVFVGGGPVYTEAGIDEMGARVNGNYQAGLGLAFRAGRHFTGCFEYRFHHISNAGRKDPNDPLNSSKVLVGIRLSLP